MLADGRFPGGAHAQSAGVELAVARGEVHDLEDLGVFLDARLHTTGLVDAAFAAAVVVRAAQGAVPWCELELEASARMPSPAQRLVSRRLGRQLARAATRVWPTRIMDAALTGTHGPHHSIAIGAAAAAARLGAFDAALVAAYGVLTTPANAALRLLGLDPVEVQALLARLAPAIEEIGRAGAAAGGGDLSLLPACAVPASELAAEEHAERTARLFAS